MNKAKAERKFGKMEKVYLTKLAPNCGCAAKVGPGTLAGVLCGLPKFQDPHLLVGTETSDDAAVYKISDELAMIQTLDFFTPVADDPYDFGQIAAANALSDVYAMGGEPKTALNIVDKLILTKPLGAGIINTAIKADLVSERAREAVLKSMKTLNKYACEILKKYTIHACTDITGFGLGGHGTEMAAGSDKTLVIDSQALPIFPDVEEYASMGLIPGGADRNREFAAKTGYVSTAKLWLEDLVFDPQTSGGLLAAVSAEEADEILRELKESSLPCAVIGEVIDREKHTLLIR